MIIKGLNISRSYIIRILTLWLVLFCVVFTTKESFAFEGNVGRTSLFIYRISEYIGDKGNVCFYGYDGVVNNFKINKIKAIELKNEDNAAQVNKCKIVYIAQSEEKYLKTITERFNYNGIATVGLLDSFLESGGSIFVGIGRRGNFELVLNDQNIEKYNIKLNPIILNIVTDRR